MKKENANIFVSVVLILFAGFYACLTSKLPARNLPNTLGIDFMPWMLVAILFFLSTCLLVKTILRGTHENFNSNVSLKEGMGVVFLTVFVYVYVKAIQLLGFITITPVFLAILMRISGSRKWKEIVLVSIASSFCVYFFFQKIFKVILPSGSIF